MGLKVESFIGGFPIEGDKDKCKNCHIAVGAPGRVKHLIKEGILKTNSVRLMILDEVDKLMESSFLNDINEIYNSLPDRKQIITTSATYSNELKKILCKYMLSPINIAVENNTPLLLGLKHFVKLIKPHANVVQQMKIKNEEILNIFSNISFTQCLVFTNYQTRAQSISNILNQKGWHSTYISAAQSQTERLETVKSLKNFKCRIMLSTDLTARGIDAANVDLVINYDVPIDAMTYLHRMGRAGRYGSSGICINLAFEGSELQKIQSILGIIGGQSLSIPKLPKFDGSVLDLLNMEIPSENHIYGTISNDTNTTKINIKKNILELKQSKMHNEKKKPKEKKENKSDLHENYSEIKSSNTEKQIMDILNASKKEVKAVSENLSDVDPSTILKSLASGDLKMDLNIACGSSSYPALQQLLSSDIGECKKRKRSTEDKLSKLSNSENDKLLEKQKAEDDLYYKNRALLSISKILTCERHSDAFDVDSVQHYLNNLKDQDKKEISEVMIKK
ncbi:hypothetical protein NQ314_006711 [Rhamnusium bicolor]|uniref:RNA helicase n=1 Tax=Rhamnusium bicolor TaxID=1586634 RepID=A0AAV8Z0B8_9CUCU|nr:hypothetical protein NQ314_006711 [Rhamnusium bicolor]